MRKDCRLLTGAVFVVIVVDYLFVFVASGELYKFKLRTNGGEFKYSVTAPWLVCA